MCTACQNISGMKRKRKVKVGTVEVGVDTLKNGAAFLGGFMAAEYAGQKIGEQIAQLNTTMARAGTKAVLATVTAVAGVKAKQMKIEIFAVAGGMGASAIKDVAISYLPSELVAYIPTTTPPAIAGGYRSHNRRIGITMDRQNFNRRRSFKAA